MLMHTVDAGEMPGPTVTVRMGGSYKAGRIIVVYYLLAMRPGVVLFDFGFFVTAMLHALSP